MCQRQRRRCDFLFHSTRSLKLKLCCLREKMWKNRRPGWMWEFRWVCNRNITILTLQLSGGPFLHRAELNRARRYIHSNQKNSLSREESRHSWKREKEKSLIMCYMIHAHTVKRESQPIASQFSDIRRGINNIEAQSSATEWNHCSFSDTWMCSCVYRHRV